MPTLDIYLNNLDDPRTSNAPRHKFSDLMTISLLCALCGGDTAVDMEVFNHMKEDFLREFLELPYGVPCHDAHWQIENSRHWSLDVVMSNESALNNSHPSVLFRKNGDFVGQDLQGFVFWQ